MDGVRYSIKDGVAEVAVQPQNIKGISIKPSISYGSKTYNVTGIAKNAFAGCRSLTEVTIPNSVANIGLQAFHSCSSLAKVTLGNRVNSIGNFAFYGCTSLESIKIPNSVTTIGNNAFLECTSLESVIVGNGVTSIGSSAFWECVSLRNVYYTDSASKWLTINIGVGNDYLKNATITYNYKG